VALAAALSAQPALAQVELAGSWAAPRHEDVPERAPGPNAVDYTGLPLNDEGRAKALAYEGSILSMVERQCVPYSQFYLALGPFGLNIWNETDPVNGTIVAIKVGAWEDRAETTIWMDGRPHPSESAHHPLGGFTTGRWENDVLVTRTTHMKASYSRRNGAPTSDRATMTAYYIRHGELLTVVSVLEDPVYFTEPFVKTKNFRLDPTPIRPIGPPCQPGFEGSQAEQGKVPHYLPGKNPFVDELSRFYNIPVEATLGGAQTMYPEFRKTLRDKYVRPE
jgi:hypothetical protein